ncbi:rho GTPase-activating protein 31 [Ambystoma mexicanum]|uniref:rho GTPase-activating protein 31 n=1 Tax=Ambystoma mexicanum TaxID=8296 RepID=UPI0037E8A7B5
MKNKGSKPKCKKKGAWGAFGCDLTEHLETSGQDVPLVLKSCAEFIETHGVVDGIYRLSGVTSNIQKLRQEFGSDQGPDLTKEVYLQDIHCVGSLCKLYFRELPNPLLTYELYKKFTEAVSCFAEREQLARIQHVIQELPPTHYRTLEYLSKHLSNIASFSSMTNMHTRNLALVWAPNLLRSKEIEASGCNGDAAFLEVRVQQVVIEFILNHVDELFNSNAKPAGRENDDCKAIMKCMTLPSMSMPMKLVSLEEAQARSLAATHPARKERRENSLPEIGPVPGTFFHTVIDLPDNKRKLSTKSKKWKSIFNLGRSGADSKSKLSRNGSVFERGPKMSEKATIRPAKSMDSLCSLPTEGEEEKMSRFKRSVASGGFFIPVLKSRNAGTGSTFDLSKHVNEWEQDGETAGCLEASEDKANIASTQPKLPPEQMKVFRVGEDSETEQNSPKMRRMFYAANEGSSKSNFPGSLFPLEASPRHQRKAMNISEPFAVSVPLRVSAVISSNSTPCRAPAKDKSFLSSLEELPSPELAEADEVGLEEEDIPNSEENPSSPVQEQNGKDEAMEANSCTALTAENPAGLSPETQRPPAIVEPIRNSKLAREKSESGTTSSLEESPSAEKIPGSVEEPKTNLDGDSEGISKENQSIPEGVNAGEGSSVPEPTHELLNNPLPGDPVADDLTNPLMEPLWPEIQQVLKIIESEEELRTISSNVGQPQSLEPDISSSVESNSSSTSSGSHPALPEADILDTPVPVTAGEELTAKEEARDTCSLETNESKNIVLENCTEGLSKLEDCSPETAPPKSLSTIVDSKCDSRLHEDQHLDAKLPKLNGASDKSSPTLTGQNTDQGGAGRTSGNLQPSPTKTHSPTLAETWGQVKKDLLRIHPKGSREINDLHLPSSREDILWQKPSKGQTSFNQQDNVAGPDGIQGFDLVEPWEDHQWVTSPLHSPKLKDIQEKEVPEFLPSRTGPTREVNKRPEFSRSLSLDSKDTRMSRWTVKKALAREAERLLEKSGRRKEDAKTHTPHHNSGQNNHVDVSGKPSKLEEPLGFSRNRTTTGSKKAQETTPSPVSFKEPKETEKEAQTPRSAQPSVHLKPVESLRLPNISKEVSTPQNAITGEVAEHDSSPKEPQSINGIEEETPSNIKNRPCSLNVESILKADDVIKLENSPGGKPTGINEPSTVTQASLITPGSCKTMDQSQTDSWPSPFNCHDLDYMVIGRATTGRRNSAPVSVSAVRTSFMIKMCQAKAVPVIPPKLQYTQIPQPLQAQNVDSTAPVSDREVIGQTDFALTCRPTFTPVRNHLDSPKSPWAEKKAMAEKENSDPSAVDSTSSQNTGSILSADPSPSDHSLSLDAPVLRRKRVSDGESTGESSLSSKIERPSGFSKPSYRSRPGRPQSLILFSPPFPFMDHPSSQDSRTLLSPIKSPSYTNSQDSVYGEPSGQPRTPDGVTLRNKMTIPKSGQRLETSTSCFYQPQRRSVILDSRSSRHIE